MEAIVDALGNLEEERVAMNDEPPNVEAGAT